MQTAILYTTTKIKWSDCRLYLCDVSHLSNCFINDYRPVKEFSVPKGVNAFTYCEKAKVIVTGGKCWGFFQVIVLFSCNFFFQVK